MNCRNATPINRKFVDAVHRPNLIRLGVLGPIQRHLIRTRIIMVNRAGLKYKEARKTLERLGTRRARPIVSHPRSRRDYRRTCETAGSPESKSRGNSLLKQGSAPAANTVEETGREPLLRVSSRQHAEQQWPPACRQNPRQRR